MDFRTKHSIRYDADSIICFIDWLQMTVGKPDSVGKDGPSH